jgi:hypothetical protein
MIEITKPEFLRLLGAQTNQVFNGALKSKTRSEVLREFEKEKWGGLLNRVMADPSLTFTEIEEMDLSACSRDRFFTTDGKYFLANPFEIRTTYIDLISKELKKIDSSKYSHSYVELGAGYGSILHALSIRPEFTRDVFIAGELTTTGCDVMGELFRRDGLSIGVGICDLQDFTIGFKPPAGSIFFTSYAMMYVKAHKNFAKFLMKYKPTAILFFEPMLEDFDGDSALSPHWIKYAQDNDYSRNLLSEISEEVSKVSGYTITTHRKNVFASNPLLPISLVIVSRE